MSPLNNDVFLHDFFPPDYFSHFSFCKEVCYFRLGTEPSQYSLVPIHTAPVNLWLGVFVSALGQKKI